MKKIVIITSNSIRHNYFKVVFSQNKNIKILRTYIESDSNFELKSKNICDSNLDNKVELHFDARHNTEYDFFSDTLTYCEDRSNSKVIKKGNKFYEVPISYRGRSYKEGKKIRPYHVFNILRVLLAARFRRN